MNDAKVISVFKNGELVSQFGYAMPMTPESESLVRFYDKPDQEQGDKVPAYLRR